MTIKQQGGIFGRNPTFNTITSDGNASIGGDIVLQGGNKVYFDGGVDNYMDMFSADKIRIAVGGAASFKLENPPHNAFILNSSGNIKLLSGSGIDFSATAGTGTSELFDDYEEGTWTPVNPQVTLTITSAVYTKIGRCVNFECRVAWPTNSDATSATITGLPFTPSGEDYPVLVYSNSGSGASAYIPGSAVINLATINQSAAITNADLAGVTLRITGFYFV
jgi:hypothetical protein